MTRATRLADLLRAINLLRGLQPVNRDAIQLAIDQLLDATITADDPWRCRICGKSPCTTPSLCRHRYEQGTTSGSSL